MLIKTINMDQKILLPRTSTWWTNLEGIEIFNKLKNPKTGLSIEKVYGKTIKIGTLSPCLSESVVGKYGWLLSPYSSEMENLQLAEEYQAILQSGKQGKWRGQGPWTRGLFCRVPEKYIGRKVYQIEFDLTDEFVDELRAEGLPVVQRDVAVLLVQPRAKVNPLRQIPVQFASLYCPDWDDNHPTVLSWLEQWKDAVVVEEATGFNPILDF